MELEVLLFIYMKHTANIAPFMVELWFANSAVPSCNLANAVFAFLKLISLLYKKYCATKGIRS